MTNLDKAIAEGREVYIDEGAKFVDLDEKVDPLFRALGNLLAALDAARGEAVAWVDADTLAEVEPQYALRTSLYGSNTSGDRVPLYAAPPAAADAEEDAYVIERMGKLLAEIAIIVNGTEPHDTLWSYHDLPEKVRALKQAQQPAALAVPEGMVMVQRADIEALEAADFGRCGWSARADLAARRLRAAMLASAERNREKDGG